MKITIELNEDIIKLIKSLRFTRFNDNQYGIDNYNLYGGTFLYEEMAYILDKQDHIIDGTQEDFDGPKYDEETMNLFEKYDIFMVEHLVDIEDIIHQFCDKGGIKPGKYTCLDNVRIWEYSE